jgi:hypothetical protein
LFKAFYVNAIILITLPIPILRSGAVFIPHNMKGDITGPL